MSSPYESLQVGVIGAVLEVEIVEWDAVLEQDVVVDISGSTLREITVKRPDDTTFTSTAVFTNTGVDGLMRISTVLDDITMEGTYYIQGYVVMPGWDGRSTIGEFEVHDNLG